MKAELSRDGREIVVTIPVRLRRHGGRKTIVLPEGMALAPLPSTRDDALVKLVAKAHRWLRELESGRFASIKELAEHENLDDSYVAKVLRLTLLAPDLVEAILDGRQPEAMTWRELAKPFPVEWEQQRAGWGM